MPDSGSYPNKKRAVGLFLLATVAVVLPLVGVAGVFQYAQEAVATVQGWGLWTLPVFILVAGIVIGFALVPSHLSSLLAGILYGWWGGIAALGAVAVGSAVGYMISRYCTRDVLRTFLDRFTWSRVLARELIDASPFKAIMALTLVRLPPQVPFALGNVLAASCRVPVGHLLVGTVLGMAPRVLLVVWVGMTLSDWQLGAEVPGAFWWALGAGVVGFGGLTLWSGLLLRRYSTSATGAAAAVEPQEVEGRV